MSELDFTAAVQAADEEMRKTGELAGGIMAAVPRILEAYADFYEDYLDSGKEFGSEDEKAGRAFVQALRFEVQESESAKDNYVVRVKEDGWKWA